MEGLCVCGCWQGGRVGEIDRKLVCVCVCKQTARNKGHCVMSKSNRNDAYVFCILDSDWSEGVN